MRARINNLDENIIAVKTGGSSPQLLLYDLRNKENDLQKNVIKLKGHDREGFGLAWNPLINGKIISGSDDKKIIFYDANSLESEPVVWNASEAVEDLKWSNFDPHIFASPQQD